MNDGNKPLNKAHQLRASSNDVKSLRYRIAGLNIEIACLYCDAFHSFLSYRSAFKNPDIRIEISQNDVDKERLKHPEIKSPEIFVDNDKVAVTYNYGCLEPFVALNRIADEMISFHTILMHGAVVALDNQAYMFTASSGVGKTTRTRIFLELYPEAIVVNGDKPFIRITSKEAIACGSPWCGKEGWNTNTMVPLRAIFLLERAGNGEESCIEEISLGKAFPFLFQQTYSPEDPNLIRKTLQLLKALEGKVRIYRFRSTPTKNSVRLAYETARCELPVNFTAK